MTQSGTAQSGFFLDVGRSFTGKAWLDRVVNRQAGIAISQRLDLPEILGRVLAARGVGVDAAEAFLNPTLRNLLPDPYVLTDMERAAQRVALAVGKAERIAIFGDYDVDGATSSALLAQFLRHVGNEPLIYIPDRLSEGYGPNTEALRGLKESGVDLVITVDCGIGSHDPLSAAREIGLDVVIVDHHQAGEHLPHADAVVNPNRQDDLSGLGHLAAVGVTYLLVIAVNRVLREQGVYGGDLVEPDLLNWLDLVALGTVCDIVPLTGLNRGFVTQGFKVMARRGNPGLNALCDAARVDRRPDTYTAGFILGPRINAAGRMGDSSLGAELLSTHDGIRAAEIARELDGLNAARQSEEAGVLDAATLQAEKAMGESRESPVVIVSGEGWHPGVIGIVAGRLKDRIGRPSIVVAFDKDGTGTGSGRSIPGVDLGRAIRLAAEQGILVKGGGHAMAAGLTVERARLGDMRAAFEEMLGEAVSEATRQPGLKIDGALGAGAATVGLIDLLERAGPFGAGNPRPRFALPAHRVAYADVVGADHIRCTLVSGDGAKLSAIAFRAAGSPLGDALRARGGAPIHVAGHLSRNEWGGTVKAQFVIEDAAPLQATS